MPHQSQTRGWPTVVLANSDAVDKLGVAAHPSFSVGARSQGCHRLRHGLFQSRAVLQFEILALRDQIGVLQRSVKRPKLTPADRVLWAWLCCIWIGLAVRCVHHEGRHCRWLASQGLWFVLELEVAAASSAVQRSPQRFAS